MTGRTPTPPQTPSRRWTLAALLSGVESAAQRLEAQPRVLTRAPQWQHIVADLLGDQIYQIWKLDSERFEVLL